MSSYQENFGQHIRRLRERRGYTQEQLASLARMHVTFLSGIERGLENPSLQRLRDLARALGVRVGKLFAFECCPPSQGAG